MNVRRWFFSGIAVCLNIPVVVFAQETKGLVPCGRDGQAECQTCHVVQLVSGVNAWLVGILSIAAAIMFMIAGFKLVTANGNPGVLQDAKGMIVNVAIGFVIVLAAWLLLDLFMKSLLSDSEQGLGPWSQISCVDQPVAGLQEGFLEIRIDEVSLPGYPQSTSRGTAYQSTMSQADLAATAGLSAQQADDLIAAAAANENLSPEQARNLQALMRVESGGCRNVVSQAGALGCMQIMPGTAKQYDPSLRNMSDAQVRAQLLNEEYNINLGTKIYADLYSKLGGQEKLVYAAYNAGEGSLQPSTDCPGDMRWECEWDSPGCHDNGRTNCTPNTGYIETRNYVKKVPGVAEKLP
jgi:hypothetical protein